MKRLLLVLLLGVSLVACRNFSSDDAFGSNSRKPGSASHGLGTDTGNPMDTKDFADRVAQTLCNNVAKCNSDVDKSSCVASVRNLQGTATDMGYGSNSSLADVAVTGEAKYNEVNLLNCFRAINSMPCDSEIKKAAYSAASPGNFNNVGSLLQASDSCDSINDPAGISIETPPAVIENDLKVIHQDFYNQ